MTEEEEDSDDSGEDDATAPESSNLSKRAIDILFSSQSHEVSDITVKHLFTRKESEEYKSAKSLFDFCVDNLEIYLIVKLLNVYRSSSNGVIRFQSLHLLSETIIKLRNRNFEISLETLNVINHLLISCLTMVETKESNIRILRRVVSFVAYDIVRLVDNKRWEELSDCILSLEPIKSLYVFIDLPLLLENLEKLALFLKRIVKEVKKILLNPKEEKQAWSLALQAITKIGVTEECSAGNRARSIKLVLKSVDKLVNKGLVERVLVDKGLEDLKKFLARDANPCKYSKDQAFYAGKLAFSIAASYQTIEHGKNVAREVIDIVKRPEKYKLDDGDDDDDGRRVRFDREWYDYLKSLSPLEVLRIFASTDLEDRSRELAIRRLKVVLSEYDTLGLSRRVSAMRKLQPLLISCLVEEGLSESMFSVLCEVVNYVNVVMLVRRNEIWYGLRHFIVSQSKTNFQRSVYIFRCLTTMSLDDNNFVIPIMETLLPEIRSRLNPPTELFEDIWVLAYTGALCAIIHLIEIPSHAAYVNEIAYNMIYSVKALVRRGREVGLVRRVFRDVESIMKKQLERYGTSHYKFIKGMLWRLYAIKGMKWESKIVLWRINVILETSVDEEKKELPKFEFDWRNQHEDEDDYDEDN